MLPRIRSVIVLAVAAGVAWGCGGERVTTSQAPEAKGQAGRPLGKLAFGGTNEQAAVLARVQRGDADVSGVTVAFARSVSGRPANYEWSGTTDAHGRVRVVIGGPGVGGYYRARAVQAGSVLGSWSSIPVNDGYETKVDLPVDGSALVTGTAARDVVTIGEGQRVQIRTVLAHVVVPSVSDWARYSAELAIRDYGPIHGHEVELGEPIDGMCSQDGGIASAERIIANPQVIGVIGTLCSGSAVAASPLLGAAGLVMISPANTSPVLTSDLTGNPGSDYHPGYFRTANNDLYQGQAVADFAYNELGLRRVVSIDDGDPYTMGLTGAFGNAFSALGGEIPATARIEKGETDMTGVLSDFVAAEPDGIFFPLFIAEGSPFAEQVKNVDGLNEATLLTDAALLLSEFLGTPQSEGVYFAGPEPVHGENVNIATGKNGDAVLAEIQTIHGGTHTNPFWAHAYDATTLLLSAINAVAVADGGKLYIDRVALRAEVGATAGFPGLIGELTCDGFGDCGTGRVNIYHHTDTSIVDPAQLPVVYRFEP
ncbi:MAG: branched-chain amino acid ABC transporter substrate-binding protein [Gemmatimonadota bacterium]|nr:branched-chain amino acid ABC transporter substrate-binding protein [Gemmatimonadota bacterium]